MTEIFDVRIDSIATGGDGVGRRNGMVVFVPRTSPGDVARVKARQDGRLMRGELLDLVTPSTDRVQPRCRHYVADSCGGCQLQHIPYEGQLRAKAGIIRDALTRIGRLAIEQPTVEPSTRQWGYRNKLTLALRRVGDRWVAGMHTINAPDKVFELQECHIADDAVLAAWKQVLAASHTLPDARELRASVRLLTRGGFSLSVEGGNEWRAAQELAAAIPALTELWWQPVAQPRRLVYSGGEGPAMGAAFEQVNAEVARSLVECTAALARSRSPATAVDAYAGTGDVSVALAALGARVTAIEIDKNASEQCAARLPKGSRAVAASVESALPKALPADVVVLNPPRAGLAARVTTILQEQSPPPRAVLYVSCDPATLARDLKRMDRYRVVSVRGFDMFPQTAHVETVCELVPAT